MLTIAYLANEFPSPVEPYVVDEIAELKNRGVQVIAVSVRRSRSGRAAASPELVLLPVSASTVSKAVWLCGRKWMCIAPLIFRILLCGREGALQRLKALVHTFLGACLAVQMDSCSVEHIHVHHGYFGSWVGMVAARLIGAAFSLTLHGSDLLIHAAYLDVKLAACAFCVTVSDYNRDYMLQRYPDAKNKIIVSRLGVEFPHRSSLPLKRAGDDVLRILAVGRLHAVKDHGFLVRACSSLAQLGIRFDCLIAGEGPERISLESLIGRLGLRKEVTLLGHLGREQIEALYAQADVVVLTSRSEGIPLVLMEAMACGKLVLAPAITGVPELVIAGKTGFLYQPGCMDDFINQLLFIRSLICAEDQRAFKDRAANSLRWIRHAARIHVLHNFNRSKNLQCFGDSFLRRIAVRSESIPNEDFVLQQI